MQDGCLCATRFPTLLCARSPIMPSMAAPARLAACVLRSRLALLLHLLRLLQGQGVGQGPISLGWSRLVRVATWALLAASLVASPVPVTVTVPLPITPGWCHCCRHWRAYRHHQSGWPGAPGHWSWRCRPAGCGRCPAVAQAQAGALAVGALVVLQVAAGGWR